MRIKGLLFDEETKEWRIDVRQKDGRRFRKKYGADKKGAEAYLNQVKAKIQDETFNLPRRFDERFAAFAGDYLNQYSRVNKRSSRRDETSLVHLIPEFGERRLSEITEFAIRGYIAKRLKDVKPSTVNKEIQLCRHMWNMAIRWGKAKTNPLRHIRPLKEENYPWVILTPEEMGRLLNSCSESIRPIVLSLILTGMRLNEALSLKWAQVDLDSEGGWITILNPKNGRKREIPIHRVLRETLSALKKSRSTGPVFLSARTGKPYRTIRGPWEAAVKASGIRKLRLHDLRHSAATHLLLGGANIVFVSKILGHSTLQQTMAYLHPSWQAHREALGGLDHLFDPKTGHFLDKQEPGSQKVLSLK